MKGQAFTPKWLLIRLRDQMSDLVKPSSFQHASLPLTCPEVGVPMPYFSIEPCSLGNRSPNRLFPPHSGEELCYPKLGQQVHTGNTH